MKLIEIATIRTGLVLSRKKAAPHDDVKHHYKQITLKSFSNSITLQSQYFDTFISIEKIDNTYLSQVGDIVMRLREPNIAVYIGEESAGLIIPSLMAVIRVNDSSVDNTFLAYYLNSKTVRKILERELKGTTIPMIKTKDIEELEVILPDVSQQKKIVTFMKLSQKETELLDKLKREKEQFSQAVLDTIIQSNKDKN